MSWLLFVFLLFAFLLVGLALLGRVVSLPYTSGVRKASDTLWFLMGFPVFYLAGELDRVLEKKGVYLLAFPRNAEEILNDKQRFFRFLRKQRVVPASSVLSDVSVVSSLEAEPLKNRQCSKLCVCYSDKGTETKLKMFIKFPRERLGKASTQIAANMFSAPREEIFYLHLRNHVTWPSPKPFFSAHSRFFNRLSIATELIEDATVTPDWQGGSLEQMTQVLTEVGATHAKYWRKQPHNKCAELGGYLPPDDPISNFRACAVIKDNPKFVHIWNALDKYYANPNNVITTLSHGDCRVGNMMFSYDSDADFPQSPSGVVFSDFEAVCFLPFFWDFTYCTVICQDADVRRSTHEELLKSYTDVLKKNGVPSKDCTREIIDKEYELMLILLVLYSVMLDVMGLVGDVQGNSENDMDVWGRRIVDACEEASWEHAALALGLSPETIKVDIASITNGFV